MDFTRFSNVLFQLQDPFQGTNLHLELLLFFFLTICFEITVIGGCEDRGTLHPVFLSSYIFLSYNTVSNQESDTGQ